MAEFGVVETTRDALLVLLGNSPEGATFGKITESFAGVETPKSASANLSVMLAEGLVERPRRGFYRLTAEGWARAAERGLADDLRAGAERLASLRADLDELENHVKGCDCKAPQETGTRNGYTCAGHRLLRRVRREVLGEGA